MQNEHFHKHYHDKNNLSGQKLTLGKFYLRSTYVFCLAHVPSQIRMEKEGVRTYTETSHQGVIQLLWLHWGALRLSILTCDAHVQKAHLWYLTYRLKGLYRHLRHRLACCCLRARQIEIFLKMQQENSPLKNIRISVAQGLSEKYLQCLHVHSIV